MLIVAIMVGLDGMKIYGGRILKACIVVPELLRALSGDVKAQTIDKDPTHIECSADKEIKISDKEINDFLDEHHLSINENILLHMFNNPEEYKEVMDKICSTFPQGKKLNFPSGSVTIIKEQQGGIRVILETKAGEHFTFAWDGYSFSFPYDNYIPYKCNQTYYNDLLIRLILSIDDQSQEVKGDNSTVNVLLNTARDQSEDKKIASLKKKMQAITGKSGESILDTVTSGGTHQRKTPFFDNLRGGDSTQRHFRNKLHPTARSNP